MRSSEWKLHFAHPYISVDGEPGRNGKPARFGQMKPKSITQSGIDSIATRHGYAVRQQPQALYDLNRDPGETEDLSAQHPEIVERLQKLAATMRADLGDALIQAKPYGARPVGRDE